MSEAPGRTPAAGIARASRLLAAMLAVAACSDSDGSGGRADAAPDSGDSGPTPDARIDAGSATPAVRLMLHGGGAEDDAIFARFVEAAGFGRIVTLGAVPDPEGYPDLLFWDGYFVGLGAASASTINTESPADAAGAEVTAALQQADGIFIRGGDQSRYLAHWVDTPLQDALVAAWERGAVIGGSSAGTMILGSPIYDARVGGVAAWEALLDPFDPSITFAERFVPALDDVVLDTHFTERGRLGRLLVFLLRAPFADADSALGIGVDPRTALFVYSDRTAEVVGEGSVTLLDPSWGASGASSGEPPFVSRMGLWQLTAGYRIDIEALREGREPVLVRPAHVSAGLGSVPELGTFASVALDGDSLAQRTLGDYRLDGLEASTSAWRDRSLAISTADGALPGTLILTRLYEDSDYFENHFGGLLWFLAAHPETVVVALDIGMTGAAGPPHTLSADAGCYVLVLDARAATHVGVAPGEGWQTAALEGVAVRVIDSGHSWDGN